MKISGIMICFLFVCVHLEVTLAMTRAQLKKTLSISKKQCMAKNSVTEDKVKDIEKGQFIAEKNVMCYVTCIYQTIQVVKNNRLSMDLVLKQVESLYPQDMKAGVKSAINQCIDVQDKYEDLCERVFYSVKCLYEKDPPNFMTRQQIKKSGQLMKKSCMPKNDVTEDQVGEIEQGKFIEERNVMCYIACVYTMGGAIKNNKISHEGMFKQVDMMFPADMKDGVKAAIEGCKGVAKQYKDDVCKAAYYSAKCFYEADPANFLFP